MTNDCRDYVSNVSKRADYTLYIDLIISLRYTKYYLDLYAIMRMNISSLETAIIQRVDMILDLHIITAIVVLTNIVSRPVYSILEYLS